MDDSFCSDMENDVESSFEVRARARGRGGAGWRGPAGKLRA
eukprot:COSAG02_NODE_2101_length_9808_cov_3.575658_2_plen_41_part_00